MSVSLSARSAARDQLLESLFFISANTASNIAAVSLPVLVL